MFLHLSFWSSVCFSANERIGGEALVTCWEISMHEILENVSKEPTSHTGIRLTDIADETICILHACTKIIGLSCQKLHDKPPWIARYAPCRVNV